VHLQGGRWVGGCEPGMSNASGAGSGRGQCRGGERRPGGKPRARNGRASALKAVACPVRSSPVASAVPCQRPSGRRGAALGADARRGAAPAHTHKRRMGAAACGPAATHTTETRRRPHSAAATGVVCGNDLRRTEPQQHASRTSPWAKRRPAHKKNKKCGVRAMVRAAGKRRWAGRFRPNSSDRSCPSGSRPALVLAPARARALPGPCLVTTRPLRV